MKKMKIKTICWIAIYLATMFSNLNAYGKEYVSEHYVALSWLKYVDSRFWLEGKYASLDSVRELNDDEFSHAVQLLDKEGIVSAEKIQGLNTFGKSGCFVVRAVKVRGSGIFDVLSDGVYLVVRYSFLHSDVVALRRTAIVVCGIGFPKEAFVELNAAQ